MEIMHRALNLLLLGGPEVNSGKFPPRQLFFDEGEQPKVTWSQIVIVGRMNQNLDVSLLKKGHSDFWGFAQAFLDPF